MPVLNGEATARAVSASVKVNGTPVPFISIEVNNNNFYAADTYRVELALGGMPEGFGIDFWDSATNIEIEILAGIAPAGVEPILTSLLLGQADTIETGLPENVIAVSGRDYTSNFIDSKTVDHFPNQTSSQIAATLAARHGMQAVITSTKTQVGKYYEIDKVKLGAQDAREVTEWNLLTYLARFEDFDCFVQGHTLHFQEKTAASEEPFTIQYQPAVGGSLPKSNVGKAKIERSLTLGRDVIVNVISWNQKAKTGFRATSKAQHPLKSQAAGGLAQTYTFSIPNLTRDAAVQRAEQLALEISRHERILTYDGPGDLMVTARSLVQVTGIGSGADQIYFIDQIERKLSVVEGFQMTVRAKNHSVISQVTV